MKIRITFGLCLLASTLALPIGCWLLLWTLHKKGIYLKV